MCLYLCACANVFACVRVHGGVHGGFRAGDGALRVTVAVQGMFKSYGEL